MSVHAISPVYQKSPSSMASTSLAAPHRDYSSLGAPLLTEARSNFAARLFTKPFSMATKPFPAVDENGRKQRSRNMPALVKRWSSIMSALITLIYREYCLARLAEMRKCHLAH